MARGGPAGDDAGPWGCREGCVCQGRPGRAGVGTSGGLGAGSRLPPCEPAPHARGASLPRMDSGGSPAQVKGHSNARGRRTAAQMDST